MALGSLVYVVVGGLLNAFVIIDPNWQNAAIQLGATPLLGLLVALCLCRPAQPDAIREAGAFLTASLFTASVMLAVYFNPPVAAKQDLFLVALPVNFVLIFLQLRFRPAILFMAGALAAHAASILIRGDLATADKAFPIAFLAALCVPTLFAVYGLERATRRDYLHGLLQRLRIEQLAAENDVLAALSATDPLTGTANRRGLDTALSRLCLQAPAKGALLLIDIDEFKGFNDRHGHPAGDACLRGIASCLAGQLQRGDMLARFGGEEFAVLLGDAAREDAWAVAERLRVAAASHRMIIGGGLEGVTVSIGIADAASCSEPVRLVESADRALYVAKKAGRNRVCAAWLEEVG
jgi:diguanylate cyclase (GGDEF)-like protein